MTDTIIRILNSLPVPGDRAALRTLFNAIGDRLSSQSLSTAGLVIKAGGGVLVKTGAAAWYGVAKGILVTKAAATDMPALVGTVTNLKFNTFSFFCDAAGTVTSAMGTEGAALANVVPAPIPVNCAQLGMLLINPTGTGNFVGGTTALDDVTVVPTAVYINTIGAFDPTILLG